MNSISLPSGESARIRLTPWDERAFGFPTSEILSISSSNFSQLPLLLAKVDQWNAAQGVRYCVSRIASSDHQLKAAMQGAGFYFAETSLTLSKTKLDQCDLNAITPRRVHLRPATVFDIQAVRSIAANDFKFGRFLEDPFLEAGLASSRHANWAEDLITQGLMQIAFTSSEIIGFHADRLDGDGKSADLILTGTTSKYAMLSLPLWVSALESLQKRQITNASTMISAANIGVVNLYRALDFRFDAAFLGFHKRY